MSAHFLVGKAGEIIQFLDVKLWAAWHAGQAQTAFDNYHSIGIECHHTQGEAWPAAQKDALGWLLVQLSGAFAVATPMIDTHGQIALPGPYQRKIDPTNWPRPDFLAWRDALFAPVVARYQVIEACTVLTAPAGNGALASGPTRLAVGTVINVGDVSSDGWAWVSPNEHDPPGIGFVCVSYLRKL